MRTRTIVIAGVGAAAVAGALAVGLLLLADGAPPARPVAPVPVAEVLAPSPPVAVTLPAVYVTSLATDAQPEPAAKPGIRGARLARATSGWDEVPVAARENQLGPVAPFVRAALEAARDQMDSCFEEEDVRQKQRSPRAPRPGEPPPRGPGVLVLRLESRADGLDVVGTEVESYGTSSHELAQCAGHALSGLPIPAQGVTAGLRYRLKFVLQ